MYKIAIIVAGLAFLFGACSANTEVAPGDGRLAVLDDTGNVVTMAPDGTDIVTLLARRRGSSHLLPADLVTRRLEDQLSHDQTLGRFPSRSSMLTPGIRRAP